jgi:hypothetical protein
MELSDLKDILTIVVAVTATIISLLAYRRARATVLQPIRSEVIKKQSQILSDILTFLPRDTFDNNLDYVGIASVNSFLALKNLGFLFNDQHDMEEKVQKIVSGWIFCGEGHIIKDVEIIDMFSSPQENENNTQEKNNLGKKRYEDAKRGTITIDKIFITQEYTQCVKQLTDFADNPFLPFSIQAILKKLIADISTNLNIHLKNTLTKFATEFCQQYFSNNTYPNISPIGVYNEFNHIRIHHGKELDNLKIEIRKYLKIDEKW